MSTFTYQTEADALEDYEDQYRGVELAGRILGRIQRTVKLADSKTYDAAKSAKVGTMITCASCKRQFVKRSYQQAFCNNRGRGNCKDRYWNATTDRIDRTLVMSR